MTPQTEPSYKEQCTRLSKAIKLADVISFTGITCAQIYDHPNLTQFWQIACEGAGFEAGYFPSQRTRLVVLELLADREATCKRLMAMKEEAV
jgi:hypothetical protein